MNKVTVIGSGRVGSTIAYSLTCRGLADEIVMIDINGDRAMGEALDIRQGLSYDSACKVYAGTYDDAENSDIVIITSGIARKPGQSRLENEYRNSEVDYSRNNETRAKRGLYNRFQPGGHTYLFVLPFVGRTRKQGYRFGNDNRYGSSAFAYSGLLRTRSRQRTRVYVRRARRFGFLPLVYRENSGHARRRVPESR